MSRASERREERRAALAKAEALKSLGPGIASFHPDAAAVGYCPEPDGSDVHAEQYDMRSLNTTKGSSDGRAAEAPAGNTAAAGSTPAPSTIGERQFALKAIEVASGPKYVGLGSDSTEEPMKIQYTSVRFHKTIPRLDAGKGQATQDTTDFLSKNGIGIELDVSTGMVTISKGTACVNVPREGVERFGPTLAQAATHEAALKAVAAETAAKNAQAQAEAEALASAPAIA